MSNLPKKGGPVTRAVATVVVFGILYTGLILAEALVRWSWYFAGLVSP